MKTLRNVKNPILFQEALILAEDKVQLPPKLAKYSKGLLAFFISFIAVPKSVFVSNKTWEILLRS